MLSDGGLTRRWRLDIERSIAAANQFASGIDEKRFAGDILVIYAVTRCLCIIPKRRVDYRTR